MWAFLLELCMPFLHSAYPNISILIQPHFVKPCNLSALLKKKWRTNYIYGSRIEIPCCLHHVHLCYENVNISAGFIISLAVSVMNLQAL